MNEESSGWKVLVVGFALGICILKGLICSGPSGFFRRLEREAAKDRKRNEETKRAIGAAYQKASAALLENTDVVTGFGVAGLSALTIVVLLHKRNVTLTPQPPDAGEQDREASERECEAWELKS